MQRMSGVSCGQSLLEQGRTKILAVVRLSGLCGDLHFSMFTTLQPGFLKRPRHPAGKNAHQGPLVSLPARAVRCAPPPAQQRARRRLRACSWGGKGTSAGLAAPPGLRGASTWRTWQPYGAQGRARWSGAAAGPHCRATHRPAGMSSIIARCPRLCPSVVTVGFFLPNGIGTRPI